MPSFGERAARPSPPTIQFDRIPLELRAWPQWVAWRYEQRVGKATKVPIQGGGQRASSTDPRTWTRFEIVRAYYLRGLCDGIGFVFTANDPFSGIDLDKCRDAITGAIAPWAQDIVRALGSYTEITPSESGLHILVRGQLPPGTRRRGPLEMYCESRFFTMSGQHLAGTPTTIRARRHALARLHGTLFTPPTPASAPAASEPPRPLVVDDITVLHWARLARNGGKLARLWAGDTTGYSSPSEAELALVGLLAWWVGPDPVRLDRLYRQSGLYRAKWDEQHGAQTYGQMTITRALSGRTAYRQPRRLSAPTRPAGVRLPPLEPR